MFKIWHLGSLAPAMSLGKENRLGSIKNGKVADYVVLDQDLTVHATAVDGIVKYKRHEHK